MGLSPAAILYDGSGNPVSIVNDSSVYRVSVVGKILNSSGSQINPSTEDTLSTRASETTLSTRASESTLSTRASESTLLTVDGRLVTIDAVLDSIKDTDGIKKITDPLPAGTNTIGKTYVTDGSLDVDVVADNSINRLESRASIVGQTAGSGSEKKVSVIDDTSDANVKRLQTQALLAPGSTVNIGTSIPADPANLTIAFLEKSGGGSNMLVNGSSSAVEFFYQPSSGIVLAVESVLFVFTADDFEFDGASFGPRPALSNGFDTRLTISPSSEISIFNIKQNEDFLRIPGRVPVINNTGPKDLLSAAFVFGGLIKLNGTAGDKISVYIRDNMTSGKFKYLTATIYGAEV